MRFTNPRLQRALERPFGFQTTWSDAEIGALGFRDSISPSDLHELEQVQGVGSIAFEKGCANPKVIDTIAKFHWGPKLRQLIVFDWRFEHGVFTQFPADLRLSFWGAEFYSGNNILDWNRDLNVVYTGPHRLLSPQSFAPFRKVGSLRIRLAEGQALVNGVQLPDSLDLLHVSSGSTANIDLSAVQGAQSVRGLELRRLQAVLPTGTWVAVGVFEQIHAECPLATLPQVFPNLWKMTLQGKFVRGQIVELVKSLSKLEELYIDSDLASFPEGSSEEIRQLRPLREFRLLKSADRSQLFVPDEHWDDVATRWY
jgi:hypothetical protein